MDEERGLVFLGTGSASPDFYGGARKGDNLFANCTLCLDACPVDCIHPKKDEADHGTAEQLFIDPVECIDCGACVPACPVSAIFAQDDVPEKWAHFTQKNAEHFGR